MGLRYIFILVVFLAMLIINVNSQTEHSISSYAHSESSDSARCVCRPRVIINPPVCALKNSGTGCNSTTIQDIVSSEQEDTLRKVVELHVAVSDNQETVSSKLRNITHRVEELQVTVADNQETVSSELRNITHRVEDTVRKVEELQVIVADHQETVSSELRDTRRQLEELQIAVSTIIALLNGSSLTDSSPKDCSEALTRGVTHSGVYTVQPLDSSGPFRVYCDMDTDGGGWTVFQRRQDGTVDFYRDFVDYRRGFGVLDGEFWLGNDNLHRLTSQDEYELRVDLSDFDDDTRYATYDSFSIADVIDNYRLTLGAYSGTAGDSMTYHNNQPFSTRDRDNDVDGSHCAQSYHGAWWYKACYRSNLNGEYNIGVTEAYGQGVMWYHFKGIFYSLKTSEMKLRVKP